MKAHFVTFLSPGTFFHETTEKPIKSWNVAEATKMARTITERYRAKPFAFYFTTRERGDNELDSQVTNTSGNYYLGGDILTLAQVKRSMPNSKVLISNMEGNKWDRIIINNNSWVVTQPFTETDTRLEFTP
jgi:hypothetical protein